MIRIRMARFRMRRMKMTLFCRGVLSVSGGRIWDEWQGRAMWRERDEEGSNYTLLTSSSKIPIMNNINSRNPVVPTWHIHSNTKMYLFNSVLERVSPSMIAMVADRLASYASRDLLAGRG